MHAELSNVFRSDPRFSQLTPTITKLKATNVDLRGSLPSVAAINDARDAIRERCPIVSSGAFVSWNVRISETGERVDLRDGRLDEWSEMTIAE